MNALVLFILGLGAKKEGDALGFKKLANLIESSYPGTKVIILEYDQKNYEEIIRLCLLYDKLLICGHSFGGDRAFWLSNRLNNHDKEIDYLFLLDPVIMNQSGLFPAFSKPYYMIPNNVKFAECFYANTWYPASKSIKNENEFYENHELNIMHDKFPSNKLIQNLILLVLTSFEENE